MVKGQAMRKKNDATWKFLNEVTGKGKINIAVLFVVQAILGVSSVFYALFLRDIINQAMAEDEHKFFIAVGSFALLVVVQLGLRALIRFLEEFTRSTLENHFKERLFVTLLKNDYADILKIHSAEWMNRLTSDTVVVANGLTEILPNFGGIFVKLASAAVMIVLLEPKFLYLILPGGCLLLIFSYLFRKTLKKLHKGVQEKDGILRTYMQESLSGMLVVRSYGVEHAVRKSAVEKMNNHQNARMKRNHFSNICNIGFGFVMRGAYILGAFFCGYGILKGTMSYGTFMAVLQLIGQIQSPFANMSGFLPRFYSMMASCERLMEAEQYKSKGTQEMYTQAEAMQMYQKEIKNIVFRDVSFSYRDTDLVPVLERVNLKVEKGDYIAIIGSSGCGKSTLLKLLLGVYEPDQGCIEIELENGNYEPLQKWRRLFTYVPQGNCLMSGTIREIVTFYKDETVSDMTVERALNLACADFVWELPEGVDTMLGEKGAGLSEGQMQRIAIARALYADTPVLILDEATSALDEITEKKIIEKLKQLTDKTIWISTHRKAVLAICNRQIIFEDGRVIDYGKK